MDLNQPLSRGTAVKLDGGYKWLQFRYERCPDFCYHCGMIGHSESSCKTQIILSRGQSENQYGPWMRADGRKLSPQKENTYSHSKVDDRQHWFYRNGELIPKFQTSTLPQKEIMEKCMATSNMGQREEGDRNQKPITSRMLPERNSGKDAGKDQEMERGQLRWEQEGTTRNLVISDNNMSSQDIEMLSLMTFIDDF